MDLDGFYRALDERKRLKNNGVEYWMARDIQQILGYETWQNFEQAIERAKKACESMGSDPNHWFSATTKPITSGKGGIQLRGDYYLSRLACYLIAMNGDPGKPEIGMAQAYFAVQTRRQELDDELTASERRLRVRQRVKEHNIILARVAQRSGVRRFGIFQDSGYRGLYGMVSQAIKRRKGIPVKDNLLDYAGPEELAANDFRITQASRRLATLAIRDEHAANLVHESVGKEVRRTIEKLGNPMPEDLPAEPHIKTLTQKRRAKKELPAKTEGN